LFQKDKYPPEKPIDLFFKQQLIKSTEKVQKSLKITQNQEKSRKAPLKAVHVSTTLTIDLTQENTNTNTNIQALQFVTQQNKTVIRKRKLFSNLDDSLHLEEINDKITQMEKNDKRKSVSCLNLDATKGSAKRQKLDTENRKPITNKRRTLDVQAGTSKEIPKKKKILAPLPKQPIVLVCTSLHRDQIQKTKEVRKKSY
jgi:hypothetical protein